MIRRLARGLGALLVLAAALVGLPWVLVRAGAPLWPFGGLAGVWHQLVTPDMTGDVLVWLVTLLGWLAWAGFAICVIAEAANLLSGRRIRIRLPGLSVGQNAASALLVTVAAMLAVATPAASTAQAAPAPGVAAPARSSSGPQASPARTAAPTPAKTSSHTTVHTVRAGEYLWKIAERYYGDGAQFRKIAEANHIDPFADLSAGQDLIIPGVGAGQHQAPGRRTVTVDPGDSLSSFAEQYLGHADRWPEIYRLNKAVIGPDPDMIIDGTVLTLPSAPSAATAQPPKSTPAAPTHPDTAAQAPSTTRPHAPATTAPSPKTTSETPASSTPAPVGQNQVVNQVVAGEGSRLLMPGIYASVGLLLTAGVVTSVNRRRRHQLVERRRGQKITLPDESAQHTETVMRAAAPQEVLTIAHLDQVLRTIGAWCARTGHDLPALTAARVADDRIDLLLAHPATGAPDGITLTADGSVWTLHDSGLETLVGAADATAAAAPWPALVTLGRDDADAHILIDLEAAGTLHISTADPDDAEAIVTAIAMELGMSAWTAELNITLAGTLCPGLETALDHPTLTRAADIDDLLDCLEARATEQRAALGDGTVGQKRLDPDLADGWGAEVILTDQVFTPDQNRRLARILEGLPRVGIAAVTTGDLDDGWTFSIGGEPRIGHLQPHDWRITPQLVPPQVYADTIELLETSATTDTDPAPWWDHDTATGPDLPDDSQTADQPATITTLPEHRTRQPLSLTGLIGDLDLDDLIAADLLAEPDENPQPAVPLALDPAVPTANIPLDPTALDAYRPDHPMLAILGAPELLAARGPKGRSPQRCQELALFILQHPGRSSAQIADAMCISPSTVKSTATHLRAWLGTDDQGRPYFPQAVQGGYRLDDRVETDWDRLNGLLAGQKVNTAEPTTLAQALHLVNGKPLEGAAPGDYAWTQELECTIVMTVTDIALALTDRALAARDIDLARWALSKALACDPGAEHLLAARAKVEYQAGNMTEVDRIITAITTTSRQLGSDLTPDTLETLREVSST